MTLVILSSCHLVTPSRIACNLTGTNAFFVSREYDAAFRDVPDDINALYLPPDYNWFVGAGHPPSPKTIERFL